MKKALDILLNADSIIGKLICGLLYIFVYDYVYDVFVVGLFHYIGDLDYIPMSPIGYAAWITLSLTPLLVYKGLDSIVSFLCFFMYLFIYIPFIHAMMVMWNVDEFERIIYVTVMCALFSFFLGIKKDWNFFKSLKMTPSIPFRLIEVTTLVLVLLFVATRAGQMHFVNFFTDSKMLYDFREDNSEQVTGFLVIITYIQGWLSGAFFPFLLVCYLNQKKWIKVCMVMGGYFLLFMVDMQKLTFFLPAVLICFYYLLKKKEAIISQRLHSTLMLPITVICLVISFFQDDEVLFTIASLILVRTVCVAGWLTQLYYHFFAEHPYTHYGHINIVNAIAHNYPYDQPLGKVVAFGTQNANANFFLTDGLAAWGLAGFIIVGVIFLILVCFIKALSYRYNKYDLFVIFLPTLTGILNVSLFTTLLSNGMFITIILLLASNNPITIEETDGEADSDIDSDIDSAEKVAVIAPESDENITEI